MKKVKVSNLKAVSIEGTDCEGSIQPDLFGWKLSRRVFYVPKDIPKEMTIHPRITGKNRTTINGVDLPAPVFLPPDIIESI